MALWSAALFGHYKQRVDGWERRAEPGDIITVRPFSEHDRWTDTERREFLIVTLEDFDESQLAGVVEPWWDTNSYAVLPEEEVRRMIKKRERVELRPSDIIKKRRFQITLDDLESKGVDIDKMLDKELRYDPELEPILKIFCYDKLKNRHALKADGFKPLPPIITGLAI